MFDLNKTSPPQSKEERQMIDAYLREYGVSRLPTGFARGVNSLTTEIIVDRYMARYSFHVAGNKNRAGTAAYAAKAVDYKLERFPLVDRWTHKRAVEG